MFNIIKFSSGVNFILKKDKVLESLKNRHTVYENNIGVSKMHNNLVLKTFFYVNIFICNIGRKLESSKNKINIYKNGLWSPVEGFF